MDVSNPLRTVTPGVDADVLAVLDRTFAPLSGLRVAELAGRGETQVRTVLRRLEQHGLVNSARYGNSVMYLLNRDHLLADAVHLLASTGDRLESCVAATVGRWATPSDGVAIFGSVARRDGDANSDVDLLIVRPDAVEADEPAWSQQRHDLVGWVGRWTGNRAQVIEVSRSELLDAASTDAPLVGSLRDDAVVVSDPGGTLAGVLGRQG